MTKPDASFLRAIQHRTARVAISASASRGGTAGVVRAARYMTARLSLAPFGTSDRAAFARALNSATERLVDALPKRASAWGTARKLLNIFLRDSLYVGYLNRAYGLEAAAKFFEIPLDSITAECLREFAPELPRWRGVKHLDEQTSIAYQTVALLAAKEKGVARVHLDAFWWGARD